MCRLNDKWTSISKTAPKKVCIYFASVYAVRILYCALYNICVHVHYTTSEYLHDKGEHAPAKLLQIERPVNASEVKEEPDKTQQIRNKEKSTYNTNSE